MADRKLSSSEVFNQAVKPFIDPLKIPGGKPEKKTGCFKARLTSSKEKMN